MRKLFLFLFLSGFISRSQIKLKMELEFKYRPVSCDSSKIIPSTEEYPLAQQTLFIFQDNKFLDSIKTNESGKAIVKYYPGNYQIFEKWKYYKKTPDGTPMSDYLTDCLTKEWAKPSYRLIVKEDDFSLEYVGVVASRCPNQMPCLKMRHLPKLFKYDPKATPQKSTAPNKKSKK
jgi:hypothetical protein